MNEDNVVPVSDVVVVGAGIVGLTNALQLAKRGLRVTLVDRVRERRASYKVGESFLVFTSAFLRTIGELDRFISEESFIKLGVWFTVGAERREDFSGTTEWAVNADPHPPHYLYDVAPDKKWFRCMFLDMQIVRPDAEAVLRDAVRAQPNIRFIDNQRVKDIQLGEGESPHNLLLSEVEGAGEGERALAARWILDCSGRNRLLARQLGHAAEQRENTDGFQTTAVWAQFGEVDDACFDERWKVLLSTGQTMARDLYTVHLWGHGYWIWVIRLSQNRISIGATFDQRLAPPGSKPREQFWNLIRRYPPLEGVISEDKLLEFQSFRNVQHWTDTFVHPRRYAMVGDSASIIDAYYSQGIALALVTSWHLANVMEKDVRGEGLDQAYIARINEATRQDWHMLRNMVREKYTEAIEDSRFFLLSHILDMAIFWCMGSTRAQLTHWLVETEGYTDRETSELRKARERVSRQLFYSRSPYWLGLSPERVQRLQRYLQGKLAARAHWRLEQGVQPAPLISVLSVTAPLPRFWRLLSARRGQQTDLTARDLVQPAALRPAGTANWFDRLPLAINTKMDWVIRLRPLGLLLAFACGYAFDVVDTARLRLKVALRGKPRNTRTPSSGTSSL
ncbi:FAD-dependent oxidoreductase [Pseudomonas oryzihabitans]|nr:FAD-dependent oxidoreductase [Pseudomonas psychrotolerans]